MQVYTRPKKNIGQQFGLYPKGRPCKMCESVQQKLGHTKLYTFFAKWDNNHLDTHSQSKAWQHIYIKTILFIAQIYIIYLVLALCKGEQRFGIFWVHYREVQIGQIFVFFRMYQHQLDLILFTFNVCSGNLMNSSRCFPRALHSTHQVELIL